jgi:hypothetical protein
MVVRDKALENALQTKQNNTKMMSERGFGGDVVRKDVRLRVVESGGVHVLVGQQRIDLKQHSPQLDPAVITPSL